MFTKDERDFMVLYLRLSAMKPSPTLLRAIPQNFNPHEYAEFVWEYYAGMGSPGFHNLNENVLAGAKSLQEKGLISIGERQEYMNIVYNEVRVHLSEILAKCPRGRRDMPAHVFILNALQGDTLKIYKNSRRAAFVDTSSGKKLAYRLSAGEMNALKFLLDTGFLVESVHQGSAMGSKMQEVMLSAQAMPDDIPN